MAGNEEVIEPNYIFQVIEYMSIPCDQPAEAEYSTHLGPFTKSY